MTYDATASASPSQKTIGTALGDTWSAECSIPVAGEAELDLFLKTSDGSVRLDDEVIQDDFGNHATNSVSTNLPVGTITSPIMIDSVASSSAPSVADHNVGIVQMAPSPGYIVFHTDARASNSAPALTCHLSIQSIPETISAHVGSMPVRTPLHALLLGR